jgi:hypothetical protein
MKKFLVVLLSLGLIAAFSMTASAADVKFSGSYYVVGWYADNQKLGGSTPSAAAFWQRFRTQPVFEIAEGLTLTARWDAMEKGWGSTDWRNNTDDMNLSRKQIVPTAPNAKIQENFEWERGYVTFKTVVGVFDVGYQSSGKWGTDFNDDEKSRPRIKFTTQTGPMTWLFVYEKNFESYYAAVVAGSTRPSEKVDADNESYAIGGIYNFKGGNTGLLYKYVNNSSNRPTGAATKAHILIPYMKATFGPVYVEAEVDWYFGKLAAYESPAPASTRDKDWNALGAYIKARMNLGPAYFGGAAMYSSGDDGSDPTKSTALFNGSGNGSQDLDVGLILGNDSLQTWQQPGGSAVGNGGANGFAYDSSKYNSYIFSGFAGFDATPKLNLEATLLYARLDKTSLVAAVNTGNNVSKDLGYEFDITAKYKIFDNLTYLVGAGYLWAGDAFKGNNAANTVSNDYLLMNRLSVSF